MRVAIGVMSLVAMGCAGPAQRVEGEVIVLPDVAVDPKSVRIDAPTALLMDLPGAQRLPVTGQLRLSTRALAAGELALRGYCPHGFKGPAGIEFSPDRSRATYRVHCL